LGVYVYIVRSKPMVDILVNALGFIAAKAEPLEPLRVVEEK
jgi:hypothetical protein